MNKDSKKRLQHILRMAMKLNWFFPEPVKTYPCMQGSEVEKCMIAMVDDFEYNQMKEWCKENG